MEVGGTRSGDLTTGTRRPGGGGTHPALHSCTFAHVPEMIPACSKRISRPCVVKALNL